MTELFGSTLFPDPGVLAALLVRLAIDLVFTGIIIGVYFFCYRHRNYVFTYVLLNVVTFSIGFLLSKVPIELGFAIGLFGIFGILRYRTEPIPVRDLTYLFAVIGIALLNAVGQQQISLMELALINAVIALAVVVLEAAAFSSNREQVRQVVYDRLELLAPGAGAELIADLRQRTRLPVTRVEIGDLDLLKDTAALTIYYPWGTRS